MNKFSKHELSEEEKNILDCLPIPTEVYEIEGKKLVILYINKTCIDMYGTSYEETIDLFNEDLFKYVHPEDKDRMVDAVDYAIENGLANYECTYRTLNRKTSEYFWLHEQGRIIKENGVKFLYINYILPGEYEELYKWEEEVSLDEEYKKKNKFIDAFFARLSHNMRTPMNAIINLAEFGKSETEDESRTKYFKDIKASGEYLLGILNDMLDLQTLESDKIELKPEIFEYKKNIDELMSMFNAKALNKDIELRHIVNGDFPKYISMDKYRFNQILGNLLSNAIKYTPNYGKVSLKTEIMITEKGDTLGKYTVIDNGIGMSKEFLGNVFEPFAKENNPLMNTYESSGLGLAIVKNLVELMDGKIWVNSVQGKGSAFVFIIPLIEIEICEDEKTGCDENIRKLNDKNILIVDDNEINIKILGKILEKENCVVVSAYNGLEALEKYKRHDKDFFDAIVMDVKMPIMDGYASTKKIREENKDVPIIILSANAYKEDVKLSLSKGANAHLAKPIDKVKLLSTLEFFV